MVVWVRMPGSGHEPSGGHVGERVVGAHLLLYPPLLINLVARPNLVGPASYDRGGAWIGSNLGGPASYDRGGAWIGSAGLSVGFVFCFLLIRLTKVDKQPPIKRSHLL